MGSGAIGLINNTAAVSANEPDLTPANNRSSAAFTAQSNSLVYFNDFDGVVGPEWTNPKQTTPACGSPFLGEYGNESAILNLSGLPAHTQVMVAFDLHTLRSWNGNLTRYDLERGPDYFRFDVDGNRLLNTTFSNNVTRIIPQFFPGQVGGAEYPGQTGAMRVNSLCYQFGNKPMDATYHLVQVTNHTGSTLTLDFSGFNLQELANESWGLDNVAVYVFAGSAPALRLFLPITVK